MTGHIFRRVYRGAISTVCGAAFIYPNIGAAQVRNSSEPHKSGPVQPASADSGNSDEIVVTGSRLANGFSTPTPVAVVGADRIQERAATNIGDALNEIPAFRATNTPAGAELSPAAGYVGGRILDLRGLGSARTLTLIDGKRFVPSTTQGTVDTNMIPGILLQRAEVVTGGASAQYGSDAVAGVVNLILDKKLDGIRGNTQMSVSKYGDNRDYVAALAAGFKVSDTLHLVVGGEYEDSKGIGDCVERPWCKTETLNFGRNVYTPGNVPALPAANNLAHTHPSTVPFNGVTVPPATAYNNRLTPLLRPIDGITFNDDGTPRRFQYGSLVNNLNMVGGEGANENAYFKGLYLVAPTQRYAITGNLDWEPTPDITASLMVNYGHLEGHYNASEYRNSAITIQATNPFIPRSADPSLDIPTLLANNPGGPLTSFQLGKGFDEIGPAPLTTRNDVIRVVASLQGSLGSKWVWDAYYQYGHNKFKNKTTNQVITSRITKALNAVRNTSGQIVCGVNADADLTNDDPACVAYNPFGNQASAAAKAYVIGNSFQTNITTEHVAAANLRGDLFDLPYGAVAVAAGGEYRSDSVSGETDALSQGLAFFSGNGSQISGRVKVIEGYLETELPLLRGLPFANELSLNGAVRRTHYKRSSAFSAGSSVNVTTYKYGAVFEPVEAIRFRATKSRDIRAPNVSELFGPRTRIIGSLNDPQNGGAQVVTPIFGGANAALSPEKADTFTAGIVLKPGGGFWGRFRGSVDYYDIKIKDAISTLGQQNIANRCAQGDPLSCSNITRDSTGTIISINDVLQNVNQQIERGVDFELSYNQPLDELGSVNVRLLATYIKDFITVDAVGPVERAGQTGLRAGTPPGVPDWVFDGLATWNYRQFSLTGHVRYINSGIYSATLIGPNQPGYNISLPNSADDNSVPGKTYVDVLMQYHIDYASERQATVYFGVDNLFNTDPPLFSGAHGTGNNQIFTPNGQTFKAGIRFNY